jgi:hypothetical protein
MLGELRRLCRCRDPGLWRKEVLQAAYALEEVEAA